MKVEKVYEWFGNLTYLEQHKLTDKYFNSVNPTRLANGQVLEIYIEEQVNVTLGDVSCCKCIRCGTKHPVCLKDKMCYTCDLVTEGNYS